jgi:hypothetical protein
MVINRQFLNLSECTCVEKRVNNCTASKCLVQTHSELTTNFTNSGTYNSINFVYDQTQIIGSSLLNREVNPPYYNSAQKHCCDLRNGRFRQGKPNLRRKGEEPVYYCVPELLRTLFTTGTKAKHVKIWGKKTVFRSVCTFVGVSLPFEG